MTWAAYGNDVSAVDAEDGRPREPYLSRLGQLLAECDRRGMVVDVWAPTAEAFVTDLRQAVAGGAAGWCFHNGNEDAAPDGQPRRSFDLRERRLFDQLDGEERKILEAIARAGSAEA